MQAIASVGSKLRRCACEHAVAVVASVGIVPSGVTTHDGLTLLVTRCALSTGTLESIAAVAAIWVGLVFGTVGRVSGALLFGIARARAGSADFVRGCELAAGAAVFVRIVAYSAVHEFACVRVATTVTATSICTSTIALFIPFYDAIAAGLARKEGNTFVVAKAS